MKWLRVTYHFVVVKKCSGYLRCTIMIANVCCLGGVWCTENVNLSQSVFFFGGGAVYHYIDVLICGGFLRCTCGFCFRFWTVSGVQEAGLHPEALHQPEL